MTEPIVCEVLEATGYLANGAPAHGVQLGPDSGVRPGFRSFSPDALWRSESDLTVYFKYAHEEPPDDRIAMWQREVWNQGFAPLLWVISPESIGVYNGFGRPAARESAAGHLLDTFRRIESDLDRLNAFAGRLAMETGEFWRQAQGVHRGTCVDRQLLSDLGALERDLLAANLDRSSAQGLIGRSIFTQYLIDRGIVTRQFLTSRWGHETLSSILRDQRATERLFDWLRETFNGDMFPAAASSLPGQPHLQRVADFLEAVDPGSGQGRLFPYQFDVVPVELISSIYEQFAHADPASGADETKTDVHYTRVALVSLVMDEVAQGLHGHETVLDLCCGSGVFLVEALRKLVTCRCNGARPDRETIRAVLHEQIYGVDISEAAVRVAAFSLYLAALELDPDPQPPEALGFKPLVNRTLIIADSCNVETSLPGKPVLARDGAPRKFDVIVGNPPWSYPGKEARRAAVSGQPRSPRGASLNFASRALEFASDTTRLGLVLSAVPFFSRSRSGADMVQHLLKRLSPVTLVNLSYQSNWLFPNSKLPAMVLVAGHRHSARDGITAVQVPWSPAGERSHTFEIGREDIVKLSKSDWLRKPELLKTAFFGVGRDMRLVDGLTERHDSLGAQLKALGTKLSSGLKYGNRSADARFLRDLPVVTKADVQPFGVSNNLAPFESEVAQWPRNREIYRAPLLLVREFLQSGGRAACAVTERDAVFTDAFRGATIPRSKLDSAHLLAAILNSSLAAWFFLMTGSTFGLWMQRLLGQDIEELPVPALANACRMPAGRRMIELGQRRTAGHVTAADWHAIDEAVFDLYELDETDRIVARDGLVRAGWQWKSGRIASAESAEIDPDMLAYSRTFLQALNAWLAGSLRHRMSGQVFRLPPSAPHRVVRFVLTEATSTPGTQVIEPEGSLQDVLDRIGERLHVGIGKFLVGQRALRVYGPDEVVIIKPAAKRHWMGVTALDDADAVVSASVAGFAE